LFQLFYFSGSRGGENFKGWKFKLSALKFKFPALGIFGSERKLKIRYLQKCEKLLYDWSKSRILFSSERFDVGMGETGQNPAFHGLKNPVFCRIISFLRVYWSLSDKCRK